MKNALFAAALGLLLMALSACQNGASAPASGTIALGSCLRQWSPQPVWQGVLAMSPDAFLFLGDNVYSDTGPYRQQPLPQRIPRAYDDLAANADFAGFRRAVQARGIPVLATWDDHDYGVNDGGADFPFQAPSRQAFVEFFDLDSGALGHREGGVPNGVYHSRIRTIADLRVQFLMLDTRSFRSPLQRGDTARCPPTGLIANPSSDATLLGEAQWRWLAEALRQAADLRILASSIQVLPTQHCFEKWANFPLERQRLLSLIKDSGAGGLVLVSGDRHLAEVSRLDQGVPYPLYELTTSGLNSAMSASSPAAREINHLRVGPTNVLQDNFGSIAIETRPSGSVVVLQIRDVRGQLLQQHPIDLARLQP